MKSRYILKITGRNYERFLRTLKQLSVRIYAISYLEDYLKIEVDLEGYQKIQKIKTTYKIELVAYKGKARATFLFSKYRLFLGSVLVGILLLLFLSNLIFEVEVVHTKEEIRNLLKEALQEEAIAPFHFKPSYARKEAVKEKILKNYKEKIEWLEIEEVGTKYIVRVEERKIKKQKEETTPRNIVAKKDAMILSLTAEQGEIVKKKFDYVKKGDILIGGVIHKNEEARTKVRAEGKVFGEVWYTVSVLLPIYEQKEEVIGKKKQRLSLHLLSHIYDFSKKTYKIRKETPLFQSMLFPFSLSLDTVEEVKLVTTKYTLENGEEKGIALAKEKLSLKIPKESEITFQKVLKKQKKGSKIYVEVFFKVKEDITSYESIEKLDLSLENQKQEETG